MSHRITRRVRYAALLALAPASFALAVASPLTAHASKPSDGTFLGPSSPASFASVTAAPEGGVWTYSDRRSGTETGAPYALGGPNPVLGVSKAGRASSDFPAGVMAAQPSGAGFYVVTHDGDIVRYGSTAAWALWDRADLEATGWGGDDVMGAAMTPSGAGMWVVDDTGAVWTLGDAVPYGDATGFHDTPTGIVPTPSGKGYYLVLADGTVITRGDAVFHGSTGGTKPNGKHVTGLAPYLDNGRVTGYWLVADDGGIFSFGAATFHGSTGGTATDWVTSIAPLPVDTTGRTSGYAIVHEDGDAELFTGAGHTYLNAPGTPAP